MKRIIVIFILLLLVISIGAQTFDEFKGAYQEFANGISNALPFNALIGLNWSDAYIGNFPHFGAGGTIGMVTMPYRAASPVLDLLGVGTADIPEVIKTIGLPIPVWCAEGRIGGFGMPFDIGVKLGYLPPGFQIPASTGSTTVFVDYLLAGADVRFSVLEGGMFVPALSVGGSANFLKGNAYFRGVLGGDKIIDLPNSWHAKMTKPDVDFNWEALVFDAKAHASWNLALLTPYVGAGLSYAPYAKAGGGLQSSLEIDPNTGTYTPISQSDIDTLKALYPEFSQLNSTNFLVSASTPPAWSIRVYGGFSVNFLIVKLDITGLYNFLDGAFGLSANIRVQL